MAGFAAKYGHLVGRPGGFAQKFGHLIGAPIPANDPNVSRPVPADQQTDAERAVMAQPETEQQGFLHRLLNPPALAPEPPPPTPSMTAAEPPGIAQHVRNALGNASDFITGGAEHAANFAGGLVDSAIGGLGDIGLAISPPPQVQPGPALAGLPGGNEEGARSAAVRDAAGKLGPLAAAAFPPALAGMGALGGMRALDEAARSQSSLGSGVPAVGSFQPASSAQQGPPTDFGALGGSAADIAGNAAMLAHGAAGISPSKWGPEPPAPPSFTPGQPALPPGASPPLALPPAPGYNEVPITNPSHLLPEGDVLPPPRPGAPTINPRTGEILDQGQPAATGQTVQVPPGGFTPEPGLPPSPERWAMENIPPDINAGPFDRRAGAQPDRVSIAPPPEYPPLPATGKRMGAVDQVTPLRASYTPEPPPPEGVIPGEFEHLPVINGEFERVPSPPPPAGQPPPAAPQGPIWPALPKMDVTDRELQNPGRHVNMSDSVLKRSTAVGSILGPTEQRMAGAGAPIAPGTGGTGLADLFTEGKARAAQRSQGFEDNVLQGIDKKFPEGSAGDLAAARFVEGKADPADMAFLRQNPDLMAAAERWQQGAQEAFNNPEMDVKGSLQNYLTHARARGESPSVMDFFNELERGSNNPALKDNPLTSYMQRSRSGAGQTPPSLVRAAKAYGRAGGFQMDLKPLLMQAKEFIDSKAPDGSPVFDAADKEFVTKWLNDAVMGREQAVDAMARHSTAYPTALLNKALSTVGLPTIDNPLKAAVTAGKTLANITLVRPAAAAVSHFLGDVWPKFAEKGIGGIGEYAKGADQALRAMPDSEWSKLERLGVAQRLPTSELGNPLFRGLSTAAQRTMGMVNTVDTISKVGSFYAEFQRLVDAGMPEAEAESKAATITRARNYYSSPENSVPMSTNRLASPFYQFLKPSVNAIDNLRNWAAQGNGAAYVRTALGAAGLYALGQATGTDILHRIHLLPHSAEPAMLQMAGKAQDSISKGEVPDVTPGLFKTDDPLGIGLKNKGDPIEMKQQRREAYLNRKRRQRE